MDSPRHPEPSDAELVRAAQAGDRDALDQLVTRHGRRVLSVARGVTRHREDAEDVAQEVFVRLIRTIERVDPDRPIEAWLVRLTLNAARSARTRSPRRREDALEAAGAGLSAPPEQGRGVEEAQLRTALAEAVLVLGEREREVFLLRDVEGLDVAVLAEVFQVAEVTVRRQSSEARRKVTAWFRTHRPELL